MNKDQIKKLSRLKVAVGAILLLRLAPLSPLSMSITHCDIIWRERGERGRLIDSGAAVLSAST
jgi:hypothetical protein